MKKKLFQFAVIRHEETYVANGNQLQINTTMLIEPKTVIAADERTALLMVAKEIPDSVQGKLNEVEILIRPF